MIGRLILENCLLRDDIAKVTSITRKSIGIQNNKLIEIIHDNFLDYTSIQSHLSDQDVCFYCIGVYTGQVPVNEFKKITVDFTKAFADSLKQQSPDATFCFLSGQGADSSEKSRILFAREKGIAENYLLAKKFAQTFIFRPGYIYPVTPRKEPNLSYKIMRKLYKPVSMIYPNIGVTSIQLSNKMVTIGMKGGDRIIYENNEIRE